MPPFFLFSPSYENSVKYTHPDPSWCTLCTQVIDAEMYAVLAYLRKMATAEDAADRRCLVLSDCKPALQQIEAAYRKGSLEGLS